MDVQGDRDHDPKALSVGVSLCTYNTEHLCGGAI
jgi:hypothetical protein